MQRQDIRLCCRTVAENCALEVEVVVLAYISQFCETTFKSCYVKCSTAALTTKTARLKIAPKDWARYCLLTLLAHSCSASKLPNMFRALYPLQQYTSNACHICVYWSSFSAGYTVAAAHTYGDCVIKACFSPNRSIRNPPTLAAVW